MFSGGNTTDAFEVQNDAGSQTFSVKGNGNIFTNGDLTITKDLTVNGNTILGTANIDRVEFNARINSDLIFSNDANRTINIFEKTSGGGVNLTIKAGGTTANLSIGGVLNLIGGEATGASAAVGGNAALNGGPGTTRDGDALVGNSRGNTFLGRSGGSISMFGEIAVPQASHIIDPSGGSVIDVRARTAIDAILVAIEDIGITADS